MTIRIEEAPFGSPRYQESLRLREAVLRIPIGMVLRDKDIELDHTEFHVVALEGNNVVGCVLLRPLSDKRIKLRQMAVADNHQGQGVGAKLVRFAEALAKRRGFTAIETNARKVAQGFYEKLGYEAIGGEFLEINIIHTLMMKKDL